MNDPFETRLKNLAQEFSYPPTPQIAEKVITRIRTSQASAYLPSRKLAISLMVSLIVFISLMAVPSVRADVIEFIQIGVVRIFPATNGGGSPTPGLITATPAETPISLLPLLESIAGEMPLEQARQEVAYPIPLPTYPADLGNPNRVFIQDKTMVILVWLDPKNPEQVKMSMHLIPSNSWAVKKVGLTTLELTTVNGQQAAWTTGTYPLILHNENMEFTRLINGHVLVWAEGSITYRIETNLSMEEAVKIAKSLQTPPDITPTP